MVGFERRTDDCACDDVPVSLNENSLAVLRDTEFAFRCRFTFFILTVVILMNLLIAMMADTFSKIAANAKAECTHSHHSSSCPGNAIVTRLCADQMQLAKIIKECYETTVFPVPLNALEHLANRIAGTGDKYAISLRSTV